MLANRNPYLPIYSPEGNKLSFDEGTEISREYFSGANVNVYFGDIWVDQLFSIEFSLQEQVAPIFGFNSYTWDRIARGSRFISGTFTINFTENGYLQTILDSISSKVRDTNNGADNHANEQQYYSSSRDDHVVQKIIQSTSGGNYDSYINALKNSFWGNNNESNNIVNTGLQKDEDTYFYSKQAGHAENNPLREQGFNILIDYNPENNDADFQNCLNKMGTGSSVYNTFRTLIGVHITNIEHGIINDGNALQERYSFIARDLDGNATLGSLKNNFRYDFSQ